MKYTLYKTTGEIVSIRDCSDITQQVLDPYILWIEGEYSPSIYYIDNGIPVKFPAHSLKYPTFDYSTKTWSEDIRHIESDVRGKRNTLLASSDWTQLPNGPLTSEQQIAWATYRQQLRDVTAQPGYPTNVVWPTPPGSSSTA